MLHVARSIVCDACCCRACCVPHIDNHVAIMLRAACRVLRVACCMLRVACCMPRVACCMPRAACCVPRVACRVLRVACCMLRAAPQQQQVRGHCRALLDFGQRAEAVRVLRGGRCGELHQGEAGLTPATSAPGLGAPLPQLNRDGAHPGNICPGTGLTPMPHLRRDWARRCGQLHQSEAGLAHPKTSPHVGSPPCDGTGLTPATSAPGMGSPLPHLRRDWAHPCHICTGTALTPATSAPGPRSAPATSAPGLRSPLPHLRRDCAQPRPHLRRDCAQPRPHLRRDCAPHARGSPRRIVRQPQ
jgi:hypothetical protein